MYKLSKIHIIPLNNNLLLKMEVGCRSIKAIVSAIHLLILQLIAAGKAKNGIYDDAFSGINTHTYTSKATLN